MVARNPLFASPPFAVEQHLKRLGANLRIARIRRKLTIADVAEKIGTGPRAVSDAEKGKLSTGIGIFVALLWAFDLLGQLDAVADPDRDDRGKVLASARGPKRARHASAGRLSDDF